MSEDLNQLAEQAANRLHMRLTPREALIMEFKRYAESATQSLREQLEQARDSSARIQKHRDDWRGYAYGQREKPADYLDGNKVDRGQTRIEQLEQERDALKAELERLRARAEAVCDEDNLTPLAGAMVLVRELAQACTPTKSAP